MSKLLVETPMGTALVIFEDEVAKEVDPKVSYMLGWSPSRAISFCESKGWPYETINSPLSGKDI